jgi:hypothetical protein
VKRQQPRLHGAAGVGELALSCHEGIREGDVGLKCRSQRILDGGGARVGGLRGVVEGREERRGLEDLGEVGDPGEGIVSSIGIEMNWR